MAVFCLAESLADLKERSSASWSARRRAGEMVRAEEFGAAGAMAALLKDAIKPNLVQTVENNPADSWRAFANIAHGCNSVMATRAALKLADYVVTEAGFGADLGAEKFFDIKCRQAGSPAAAVVVATLPALRYQGGAPAKNCTPRMPPPCAKGLETSAAIWTTCATTSACPAWSPSTASPATPPKNSPSSMRSAKKPACPSPATHWADGGAGAVPLAEAVLAAAERPGGGFRLLYPDEMPLWEKLETIATKIYGAGSVSSNVTINRQIAELEDRGFGNCRSASPKPNIRSPPIPPRSAWPMAISSRCAKCASAPGPALW
jgi:formate--tetrahydrofolate ligase